MFPSVIAELVLCCKMRLMLLSVTAELLLCCRMIEETSKHGEQHMVIIDTTVEANKNVEGKQITCSTSPAAHHLQQLYR